MPSPLPRPWTAVRLVVVVALSLAAIGCSPRTLDFAIGECVNLPDGEEITDYEQVECGTAHDAEVYALPQHPAPEGEPYPGEEALDELAVERCDEAFESYVGTPYAQSDLYFTPLTPGQEAWEGADDREIVCLVVGEPQADGTFAQLTGSKADSGE